MNAIIGTGNISKREFDVIAEKNIPIKTSDGEILNVNIFRPSSSGRFPVLVGLSPFNVELQTEKIWPTAARSIRIRGLPVASIEAGPIEFFVRRGYVCVIGSSRGTGKSTGTYRYMDSREVKDFYELIEWASAESWSTGKVGTLGIAYFAQMALRVSMLKPPSLLAIAPLFAFWDDYRYHWWPGGIFSWGFARWLLSLDNMDLHTEAIVVEEEIGSQAFENLRMEMLRNPDIAAVPELYDALQNYRKLGNAAFLDVLLHPTWCTYWEERKIDPSKIYIPTYLGAAPHRPGACYHFQEIKAPKQLLVVGPFYVDRPVFQCAWELLRWYDYWLKEIDTGIMDDPPVKIFVSGLNEWVFATDYPLPTTRYIPFFLHSNGTILESEPWPDDPARSYEDSPYHRGYVEYATPPLVENIEIIGPMSLKLFASSRRNDCNFFVTLWDEDPEGHRILISQGWLKGSHRELDITSSKPWYPVHTHLKPIPLIPGEVYEFDIALWPTAHFIKTGHRLILRIRGCDEEPTTQFQKGMDHLVSQESNIITIFHDSYRPSYLLLPITKGNVIGIYASGGKITLEEGFMKII